MTGRSQLQMTWMQKECDWEELAADDWEEPAADDVDAERV